MNDVLAKVIVAIVMLGVVFGIAVPVLRLRGRSAGDHGVGPTGSGAPPGRARAGDHGATDQALDR